MNLDNLASKLGFQNKSGVFTRSHQGYEISLVSYKVPGSFNSMPMLLYVFNKSLDKTTRKALAKTSGIKGFVLESVGLKDNAFLSRASFKDEEKLNQYLDKMTEIFKSLNLGILNYCPYCGKDDTDGIRVVKGAVIHVHEACVENFIHQVTSHLETTGKSKEHLIKSILYAIIGGFVGLIPSIIILALTSYYSAWLFLIIPFSAFYGYKKGGAQKGSYVMIIIALISLIMAPGFMFTVYYLDAAYYNVAFSDYLAVDEIRTSFIKDMFLSIAFTALALYVSWKYIYKQTHGQIMKDIEDLKK